MYYYELTLLLFVVTLYVLSSNTDSGFGFAERKIPQNLIRSVCHSDPDFSLAQSQFNVAAAHAVRNVHPCFCHETT